MNIQIERICTMMLYEHICGTEQHSSVASREQQSLFECRLCAPQSLLYPTWLPSEWHINIVHIRLKSTLTEGKERSLTLCAVCICYIPRAYRQPRQQIQRLYKANAIHPCILYSDMKNVLCMGRCRCCRMEHTPHTIYYIREVYVSLLYVQPRLCLPLHNSVSVEARSKRMVKSVRPVHWMT